MANLEFGHEEIAGVGTDFQYFLHAYFSCFINQRRTGSGFVGFKDHC